MKLKELRQKAFMTQRDLGTKSGLAFATICRLELGKQHPTFSTIKKLAKALGVEPSDIEW